jgi:hypothetical protein
VARSGSQYSSEARTAARKKNAERVFFRSVIQATDSTQTGQQREQRCTEPGAFDLNPPQDQPEQDCAQGMEQNVL